MPQSSDTPDRRRRRRSYKRITAVFAMRGLAASLGSEAKGNKLSGNAVVTPLRSAVGRIRNAEWTGNAARG